MKASDRSRANRRSAPSRQSRHVPTAHRSSAHSANTVGNDATANRDDGSPQWLPIFNNGAKVRFVADPPIWPVPTHRGDKDRWVTHSTLLTRSRWSPRLLLNKPDWLTGKGRDVLPSTRWIPFVTFLQVSADMAVSTNVPDGHGHTFLAAVPYRMGPDPANRPAGPTRRQPPPSRFSPAADAPRAHRSPHAGSVGPPDTGSGTLTSSTDCMWCTIDP